MAGPPKQGKSESLGVAGRRSTRLSISIPISISGKDSGGHTFKESTRTLVINKQGAKIAALHQLSLGAEITIENRALGRTARANIVWLGDKKNPKDPFEVGVQLLEAENIWGIEFPPDDWQEGPPIGTGGQRLEKAPAPAKPGETPAAPSQAQAKAAEPVAAPAPPPASKPAAPPARKVPEAPSMPAAAGPAGPPSAAAVPLAPISANLDEALARFTRALAEAADLQEKSFAERLAKLTNQIGFQTQASLQDAANRLEEKTVGSLEQQLGNLADRLQKPQSEIERLLAQFEELRQNSASEVEKTQQNIQTAGFEALQAAVEELNSKVAEELETATADFVEQTRRRVVDEGAAQVEAFSKQAQERLTKLTEDYRGRVAPELQTQQNRAIERAQGEIAQSADAAAREVRDKLRKVVDEETPSIRAEMEKFVDTSVGQLKSRLAQSFQEQAQTASRAVDQSFQQNFQKVKEQVQAEIDDALLKTRQACEQEAEKANKTASERIAKRVDAAVDSLNLTTEQASAKLETQHQKIELEFKTGVENYRKQLSELSAPALEGLQRKSDALIDSSESHLEKAVHKFQEKATKEVADHLQGTTAKLAESSAKELQKQIGEAKQQLREELKTSQKALTDEAKKQLTGLTTSTVDSLNREAKAGLDEFRSQLRKGFEDFQEKSARDLEAHLAGLAERQREAILKELQKETDAFTGQAVAQIKARTEQIVKETADTVNKHVGAGAVFLKELEDQAKSRLDTHYQKMEVNAKSSVESFQKQTGDLSKATLEKLRKETEVLVDDLQVRLEQAARVYEDKSMEAIHARLQGAADKMVEESTALTRKHVEETLGLVAEQLKVRQEQAVNEAADALRAKMSEIFSAVLQTSGKKPAQGEPAETEEAKKRR